MAKQASGDFHERGGLLAAVRQPARIRPAIEAAAPESGRYYYFRPKAARTASRQLGGRRQSAGISKVT